MQHPAARSALSMHLHHSAPTGIPCRDNDADLWFADDPDGVELAKSFCLACPLREACLSGALERAEPWGVWGGHLLLNGAIVASKRRRGRPRKNEAA